jgi:hypothetical protein
MDCKRGPWLDQGEGTRVVVEPSVIPTGKAYWGPSGTLLNKVSNTNLRRGSCSIAIRKALFRACNCSGVNTMDATVTKRRVPITPRQKVGRDSNAVLNIYCTVILAGMTISAGCSREENKKLQHLLFDFILFLEKKKRCVSKQIVGYWRGPAKRKGKEKKQKINRAEFLEKVPCRYPRSCYLELGLQALNVQFCKSRQVRPSRCDIGAARESDKHAWCWPTRITPVFYVNLPKCT